MQAHQLQLLKEQARQTEDWLASKEAFLNNDDLGENIDGEICANAVLGYFLFVASLLKINLVLCVINNFLIMFTYY